MNNGRRDIWKPWDKMQFAAEQTYERVADFFGLDVSPCIKYDNGFVSLFSYNKRLIQVHAYSSDPLFSLNDIKDIVEPEVVRTICLLMFVDAICNNTDRHSGNLALLKNGDGFFVDVCPAYDNCVTFELSFGNQAMFGVTATRQWRHPDIFVWLMENWDDCRYLFEKYISKEFDDCIKDSVYFDWILNQRDRLVKALE